MLEIRSDLNKINKKEVYDFLVNESTKIDKSHKLMTEEGFKFYFHELYNLLINDNKLNVYDSFKQKLWHFLQEDYKIYYCPVCGKRTSFRSITKGYRYYCSNECKYNDDEYLKKVSENTKFNWKKCDKEEVGKNISKGRKIAWNKLSKEEKHERTQHMRDKLVEVNNNRTEEEWNEINDKRVKNWKETYYNKSDEQKEIELKKRMESYKQTIQNRNNEQLKKVKNNVKNGLKNMSDEDKQKRELKRHLSYIKRTQKIRPDVLDIYTTEIKQTIYTCKCTNPNCNKCQLKQFKITYASYKYRDLQNIEKCPIGHPRTIGISSGEKELLEYIQKIYKSEIKENTRQELDGLEIDVYLPELKLGFEFQGDIWHANPNIFDENFVNPVNGKTYKEIHEKDDIKRTIARNKGITIIEIWESDWFEDNKKTKKYIREIIKTWLEKN